MRYFVRPFVGLDHHAVFTGGGDSRVTFGAGLGVKIPMGDRFASRFEGRFKHFQADQGTSLNSLGLLAGFSIFTH